MKLAIFLTSRENCQYEQKIFIQERSNQKIKVRVWEEDWYLI